MPQKKTVSTPNQTISKTQRSSTSSSPTPGHHRRHPSVIPVGHGTRLRLLGVWPEAMKHCHEGRTPSVFLSETYGDQKSLPSVSELNSKLSSDTRSSDGCSQENSPFWGSDTDPYFSLTPTPDNSESPSPSLSRSPEFGTPLALSTPRVKTQLDDMGPYSDQLPPAIPGRGLSKRQVLELMPTIPFNIPAPVIPKLPLNDEDATSEKLPDSPPLHSAVRLHFVHSNSSSEANSFHSHEDTPASFDASDVRLSDESSVLTSYTSSVVSSDSLSGTSFDSDQSNI